MAEHISRITSTVWLITGLATAGLATGCGSHDQQPENDLVCIEVERTAEKPRILFDDNHRPFPFLPLLRSEVNQIGAILPGQQFTICSRVDRSTWNTRTAWLQVRVDDGHEDTAASAGWINMSRAEANSWIPMP